VTVGPGILPDLLTLPGSTGKRSRADAIARNHRRWGLAPRPENVRRPATIPVDAASLCWRVSRTQGEQRAAATTCAAARTRQSHWFIWNGGRC